MPVIDTHLLRKAATVLFWPAAAVVIWGELSPSIHIVFWWSKAAHVTAYFGLAGLAVFAVGPGRRSIGAMAALIGLGACLEFLQQFTGRDPAIRDVFINAAGALSGWAFGRFAWRVCEARERAEWLLVDVPGGTGGDASARCLVHRSELTPSVRREIHRQMANAPQGKEPALERRC